MCSICTIVLTGETSWKQHVRGNPHKKRAQRAASIDVASNHNAPSLRWTCPTCLVCNDSAAGLFAHVGGAVHRRAVSVLTDAGRAGELQALLPRLREAALQVLRSGGDHDRCIELLHETEAHAGAQAAGGPAGPSGHGSSAGHGGRSGGTDARADENGSHLRKRRRECDADGGAVARAAVCCGGYARDGNGVHRRDVGEASACTGGGAASSTPPPIGGHGHATNALERAAAARAVPASQHGRHAVEVPPGARVLFECRVGRRQHSTADDFINHVCST